MAKPGVTDRDRGWKKIRDTLMAGLRGRYILTGIQAVDSPRGEDDDDGPMTNAWLGSIHEYGCPQRGIPERSFLRAAMDENRSRYLTSLKNAVRRLAQKGGGSVTPVLTRLGERIRADIVGRIKDGLEPDWADSTLLQKEREGKTGDPVLWDTGQLINSIRSVVK